MDHQQPTKKCQSSRNARRRQRTRHLPDGQEAEWCKESAQQCASLVSEDKFSDSIRCPVIRLSVFMVYRNGRVRKRRLTYHPHSQVVVIQVEIPWLFEREGSVVSGDITHGPDEHLPEGRMDVEEERAVDVPGAHLPEVGLIPADPGRLRDLVESGPKIQEDQHEEARIPV